MFFGRKCKCREKKMQEKGSLSHEFCKRKGMGLEAALAHPHTKIREEPHQDLNASSEGSLVLPFTIDGRHIYTHNL